MKCELPLVTPVVSALVTRFIVSRNAALPRGGRSKDTDRGAARFNGESQSRIKHTAKRHIDPGQGLIKPCLVLPSRDAAPSAVKIKSIVTKKSARRLKCGVYHAEAIVGSCVVTV